jgi:hypothetical protein
MPKQDRAGAFSVSPPKQPPPDSTAQRILIWLRSLPSREPGQRGYIAEMQELSGLPQEECSRAAAGQARAWTTKRLDQVAKYRGVTTPSLLSEIYEVSEGKVVPRRAFKIPEPVYQEYLDAVRRRRIVTPVELQRHILHLRYMERMGLIRLCHAALRVILTRGPERAAGGIAQLCDEFLETDSPATARKRRKLQEELERDLNDLPGPG